LECQYYFLNNVTLS